MEVLKRLLYKEFRESWVVAVVFLTAPAWIVPLAKYLMKLPAMHFQPASAVTAALIGGCGFVLVWAATKGRDAASRQSDPISPLPIRPWVSWAVFTVLPSVVVLLLGSWVYGWLHAAWPWMHISPFPCGLWLAATFVVALVSGRLLSRWVGPVVGMLAAVYIWSTQPSYLDFGSFTRDPGPRWLSSPNNALIIAGAALALSVVAILLRKKSRQVQNSVAIGWVVAVPLVLVAISLIPEKPRMPTTRTEVINDICVLRQSWNDAPSGMVRYRAALGSDPHSIDQPGPNTRDRLFCVYTTPLAALDTELILLEPPRLMGRSGRLLAWDIRRDLVREVCKLPMAFRTLSYFIGASFPTALGRLEAEASISPDSDTMLVYLPSEIGLDSDAWLVDLKTGNHKLCLMGSSLRLSEVVWTADTVIIYGDTGVYGIDKRTGLVKRLIPGPKGGRHDAAAGQERA